MPEPTTSAAPANPIDPKRHPAAVANAISIAWRRYRWRAYAVGIAAGLFAGGVIAPIATTTVQLILAFAGVPESRGPWWEIVWSIAFAATVPFVSATVFARWHPQRLREAAQTYLWLARRAEENWARRFGATPAPRDPKSIRAMLNSIPESPDTAGERFGMWIALLELERARAAGEEMPDKTVEDRFNRNAAFWLVDFVAGATRPIEPLQLLADTIEEPGKRLEGIVTVSVDRARAAVAEHGDWQGTLAAVRARLGSAPEAVYHRFLWHPTFRTALISTAVAVIVFWIAVWIVEPYLPLPSPADARRGRAAVTLAPRPSATSDASALLIVCVSNGRLPVRMA